MLSLARMYDAGDGVAADKQMAIHWYERAAVTENASACGYLVDGI